MSGGGGALAPADALLTADREEVKYLLPAVQAFGLAAVLNRRLPAHRFQGPGASVLPRPQHFITTIYFDTPSRTSFRASQGADRQTIKLRAKEYYDLYPSLAELATDARQIVKPNPTIWLELKSRAGDRTGKRRLAVPRLRLPALLAGALPVGAADQEALREIARHCRSLAEPLAPSCLVNYRRLAWQNDAAGLRITVDLGLAFYPVPADIWSRPVLTRPSLGAPRGELDAAVLELKHRDGLPRWLLAELEAVAARPTAMSKFELASRAVHGP